MLDFNKLLTDADNIVWGVPLMVLIIAVGLILTLGTKFLQVFHLPEALKFMFKDEHDGVGEVSSFGALCTALSATIGTGNIVGVATAVCTGGPGAVFWMEAAAFLGMATKYAEGFLAVKYRHIEKDGTVLGGPFYYIEKGMGKNCKWLAMLFAVFGVCAGVLGIGTITQVNGITSALDNFFNPNSLYTVSFFDNEISLIVVISGAIVSVCAALIVFGGIKRIAGVSELIVPVMAVIYTLSCVALLICNAPKIPGAVALIVKSAFNPKAFTGGTVGTIFVAMQKGIARGIFSNEAGLGSAPIAAAAARTKNPVRQGLVCMTGTFFDTIILCTMTGLSIVITDAWKQPGLEGAAVTAYAFGRGLPFDTEFTTFILMLSLIFFAFTTILGWNYYSEKCLQYLVGHNKKALMIYKCLYIAAVLVGPYLSVSAVWTIADIFNGLMALPNLIALVALSGVVFKETTQYFEREKLLK